jgi:hypothetical protein
MEFLVTLFVAAKKGDRYQKCQAPFGPIRLLDLTPFSPGQPLMTSLGPGFEKGVEHAAIPS